MTKEALTRLCEDAIQRICKSINRSAGQHLRAMRNTDYSTGQPRPKEKQK